MEGRQLAEQDPRVVVRNLTAQDHDLMPMDGLVRQRHNWGQQAAGGIGSVPSGGRP